MSRNEKKNTAHSFLERLLNMAKANKEDFNLLLSRYGMERFLYRLSISPYSDRFILKGASLCRDGVMGSLIIDNGQFFNPKILYLFDFPWSAG